MSTQINTRTGKALMMRRPFFEKQIRELEGEIEAANMLRSHIQPLTEHCIQRRANYARIAEECEAEILQVRERAAEWDRTHDSLGRRI